MGRVVFLGATRGMGRAISRAMAERGDAIVLLGRQQSDLERSADDLRIRGGAAKIGTAVCDLLKPECFDSALSEAEAFLGGIDTAVVTAGLFGTQEQLECDQDRLAQVLTTNFTNTILFCEALRRRLLASGGGTICVFSSVAGDRGRKPVVLYGASKAGLSHYLEGLDHRYRSEGLKVVNVKPGFIRTSMTAGLAQPPFSADPEDTVGPVLRGIDRGDPVVYTPAVWGAVMGVIRRLPRMIMRRVSF
ncbi:MAG: SDR family NAD(P)-dependent oxidoreductase [Myxococcota bacterium]